MVYNDVWVSWDKMDQSETDDIFVSGVKAKDMITMHQFLLFLLQWENKSYDLITNGSLIFGIQRKCLLTCFAPPVNLTHFALTNPTIPYSGSPPIRNSYLWVRLVQLVYMKIRRKSHQMQAACF